MSSELVRLAGRALSALHRLEDSLDARASGAFVDELEQDALRRLITRWDTDTRRKLERELGRRG
jgi:hypothetical protein